MKSISSLLSWAVLVAGVAGVIYPAFIEPAPGAASPGLTNIMVGFVHPEPTLAYFMRVLCLAVAFAAAYLLLANNRYSRTPITVVRMNVEITFNNDLSRAYVKREQTLRANQPDVTCYFCKITSTAKDGSVPKDDIYMDAFCHGCELQDSFFLNGRDETGFEIFHEFGREMPYNWFMPLLPKAQLRKPRDQMADFIKRRLVFRQHNYVYQNECNIQQPVMTFTATTYPQFNLTISITFPDKIPTSLKFRKIKSNGVTPVLAEHNTTMAKVYVERLQNEVLHISW